MAAVSRLKDPAATLELMTKSKGQSLQIGLAKLVLVLVEVIREVLERQALRRVEVGDLSPEEVERLGIAFIEIRKTLVKMCEEFGIKPEELKSELGALLKAGDDGLAGASLVDLLDTLLDKGAVVAGKLKLSVADVDLVGLDLFAMLYPAYKSKGLFAGPNR